MLDKVHDHIVSELGHSNRTDTIFVVTAVVFNLIVLGINTVVSFIASAGEGFSLAPDLVLAIFILMTLLLNLIAVAALFFGQRNRRMLLNGLVAMYRDSETDKYYDPSLVSNYIVRYLLFAGVIAVLASTAIVVPMVIRFL
jgi:hypothetical protein